jgi:hypothetical protein
MEAASTIKPAARMSWFMVLLLVRKLTVFRSTIFHTSCVAPLEVMPITDRRPPSRSVENRLLLPQRRISLSFEKSCAVFRCYGRRARLSLQGDKGHNLEHPSSSTI